MYNYNINMEQIQDNIVIVLIIIVVLLFLKTLFYYISLTKFHHIFMSDEKFEKFRHTLSDILNVVIKIASLFIMFFRKNSTMLILILAIIFFLKSFLHFFVNYKFYQYTSLTQSNIDKLTEFYEVESFITNTMLFIGSFYILKIIFIDQKS